MGAFENLFGQLLGGSPREPIVPPVKPIDLVKEQGKATDANIANVPEATKLGMLTADQIDAMMTRLFPEFAKASGQIGKNISAGLEFGMTDAERENIQRGISGRALEGGFSGTGAELNLLGGAFGAETATRQQQYLTSAESWMNSVEKLYAPAEAAFTSMFISPEQLFKADVEERDTQWNRDWLSEQINAMWVDPFWTSVGQTMGAPLDAALGYYGGQAMATPRPGSGYPTSAGGDQWTGGGQDWQRYTGPWNPAGWGGGGTTGGMAGPGQAGVT